MNYEVIIKYHDFTGDEAASTVKTDKVTFSSESIQELIPRVLTKFSGKKLPKGSHVYSMSIDHTDIYINPLSGTQTSKHVYNSTIAYLDEVSSGENSHQLNVEISNLLELLGPQRTRELIDKQLKELNV